MIGAFLIPVMWIVLMILFRIVRNYLKSVHLGYLTIVAAVFLFGGPLAILGGFFIPSDMSAMLGGCKRTLIRIGFYWLGVMLYFVLALLMCGIIYFMLRPVLKKRYSKQLARNLTALTVVAFTAVMSLYGIRNAHDLHVTEYEVDVDKDSVLDELNIVLIGDTHLGYNITVKQVAEMVELINRQDPDVVLIAGDIFDNEYEAIEDPEEMIRLFQQIQSRYGTYAIWGNHDIQEKILLGFTFSWMNKEKHVVQADERMVEFVREAGIKTLYDQWARIEDIQLYGRPDKEKINFGHTSRADVSEFMKDADAGKPIIVLDHEPSDSLILSQYPADLYLNGHTHAGQMWPGTWTIHLFWDNAYGMKRYENLYNIVTSGVGLFGVNMRTDSIAEIVRIRVTFK
ncbi:MAG: metallophosphoesterase [Erysipelotrichaceae bacterium]|nr:metallophosphoesterase [Erysipelotrichaceae bacterium]